MFLRKVPNNLAWVGLFCRMFDKKVNVHTQLLYLVAEDEISSTLKTENVSSGRRNQDSGVVVWSNDVVVIFQTETGKSLVLENLV